MKIFFSIVFILLSYTNLNGQVEKKRITNSYEGFSYNFEKPENWVVDSENANEYLAHTALYKSKNNFNNGGSLIQILAFNKQDENIIEDLNFDVNQYVLKYKNLKKRGLTVNHHLYKTFSKEVYVEGKFHQFIVYLNPGKQYKFGISIALNINKELNREDLDTFKELIKSLKVKLKS